MYYVRFVLALLVLFDTTAPANDFVSNPSVPVELVQAPQFAPVGELQRDETLADGRIAKHFGSSVIVSPCYILTNFHVAFGGDTTPITGKDYTATFRAGQRPEAGTFAGHTTAIPVLWGDVQDDWALMRLKNCVGTMKEVWMGRNNDKIAAATNCGTYQSRFGRLFIQK